MLTREAQSLCALLTPSRLPFYTVHTFTFTPYTVPIVHESCYRCSG